MKNKLLLSLCCLSSLLSSCDNNGKKLKPVDENISATLIKNEVSYIGDSVLVKMDFDTDGNLKTPEYRGIDMYDENGNRSDTSLKYAQEMKKYQRGDKRKLRDWQKIIPNIFDLRRENQ